MPEGIGYPGASKLSSKGTKKKDDNKNLKKSKTFLEKAKKDIKKGKNRTDKALRAAGLSEDEIRQLGGGKRKDK